jgi:two-component system, cell cycle sensor histidine kinase and response regulator CckA
VTLHPVAPVGAGTGVPLDGAFRGLFARNVHPMWVIDLETLRVLDVNPAAVERYGHSREAFLALRLVDLLPPEDVPRLLVGLTGDDPTAAWRGPWRHRLADGRVIDVDVDDVPADVGGRRAAVVSARDVTERRRGDQALRATVERYRSILDNLKQVIFQINARGAWTFLNPAWTEITGFTVEESLGTSFLQYVHPEDRVRHAEVFQPLTANKTDFFGTVVRYATKSGGHRWIEVHAQLAVDADGAIRGMAGTLTDITERKEAQEELARTRARLEHLLVSSPAMVLSTEPSGHFAVTFISENVRRQLGYTVEEVLDDPGFWRTRLHPEDAPRVLLALEALAEAAVDPARQGDQYRFRHKDGSWRWLHDERRLVRDASGAPVELVASWVDVTEHRRAQEERARLSSVVEQSAEAIVITTTDGLIEYANPACERLTGYARAELIGQTPRVFKSGQHEPAFYRELWGALAAGQAWVGRFVNRRKDGTLFEAEAVISPVRDAAGRVVSYVGGMLDVTHEREIEAQLRQAQKMEIAGRLAGGVAHDFNNLLTVITCRSQLLVDRLPAESRERRDVELIEETAQRAGVLTRQLLAFSRKQVVVPRLLDVNAVVANIERMLRRLIGEDIELVTRPAPGLGSVKADPGQLEQVILNLAVNSRDAMPLGGRLTIETADVELGEADVRHQVDLRPGPYVMLTVSDTGCGIDAATRAHIFEPFFTTKGPEKGTGLGLSTVYGIVKQSDGHVAVDSEPGQGTTFRVYLPRVATAADALARGRGRPSPASGTETVLLAEDDHAVRHLAREILHGSGYTVLEAHNGADALDLSRGHAGPIHLLMTDVVMPQMSGRELAYRLTRERAETRVLFMSGYTNDAIIHHRVAAADTMLIEKPFTPDALLRRVREALDGPRGVLDLAPPDILAADRVHPEG